MDKEITLNHITKIEGHAKLNLGIDKGKVTVCELSATEGSRYFEGIVRGRKFHEASEITSRICGICSCAHVITAISAVEHAMGVVPSAQTVALRTLLTLGERIRSHATHLYFLALPDYVGYESALAMAPKFQKELRRALALIQAGNHIIKVIGGRDLHPVSATVGGWLKLPTNAQLRELATEVEQSLEGSVATVDLFASLKVPTFDTGVEMCSLIHPFDYAVLEGAFGTEEQQFAPERYHEFLKEYHEPRSTANFVVRSDKRYRVGSLARFNHNHSFLRPLAQELLKKTKLRLPSSNPFHNNLAQAIELVHSMEQAIFLCKTLDIVPEPAPNVQIRPGTGIGAVEVPRGTLWHEYTIDSAGIITNANIITPTAQNLLSIQEDIREFVPRLLNLSKEELVLEVEKLIRSYDPCFSCSAHFLEVNFV